MLVLRGLSDPYALFKGVTPTGPYNQLLTTLSPSLPTGLGAIGRTKTFTFGIGLTFVSLFRPTYTFIPFDLATVPVTIVDPVADTSVQSPAVVTITVSENEVMNASTYEVWFDTPGYPRFFVGFDLPPSVQGQRSLSIPVQRIDQLESSDILRPMAIDEMPEGLYNISVCAADVTSNPPACATVANVWYSLRAAPPLAVLLPATRPVTLSGVPTYSYMSDSQLRIAVTLTEPASSASDSLRLKLRYPSGQRTLDIDLEPPQTVNHTRIYELDLREPITSLYVRPSTGFTTLFQEVLPSVQILFRGADEILAPPVEIGPIRMDMLTMAPVLHSPASNSVFSPGQQFVVRYTLPADEIEDPLSDLPPVHAAKLVFTERDVDEPRVTEIALARTATPGLCVYRPTYERAPVYACGYQADETGDILDGTYDVHVEFQDARGNNASISNVAANVTFRMYAPPPTNMQLTMLANGVLRVQAHFPVPPASNSIILTFRPIGLDTLYISVVVKDTALDENGNMDVSIPIGITLVGTEDLETVSSPIIQPGVYEIEVAYLAETGSTITLRTTASAGVATLTAVPSEDDDDSGGHSTAVLAGTAAGGGVAVILLILALMANRYRARGFKRLAEDGSR
jgi:hypothetical protein